jgi:hypothetical protein
MGLGMLDLRMRGDDKRDRSPALPSASTPALTPRRACAKLANS